MKKRYALSNFKLLAVSIFITALGVSCPAFSQGVEQSVKDANLATAVRAAIIAVPILKESTLINVATSDGEVLLSGLVRTQDQATQAIKLTSQVEGVTSIRDRIDVRGW
ncbi:MAG: BON domain-containing protein [Alphaproteobacteria bacterium]|nr:BON domain-containing protein [Alphaproteobacteria bacterium]